MFASTIMAPAKDAVISRVPNATSSFTVLAENVNRRMVIIHNDSSADVKIKYGETASDTSYTYPIDAGAVLELVIPAWVKRIDGIASAATGSLQVTELVA